MHPADDAFVLLIKFLFPLDRAYSVPAAVDMKFSATALIAFSTTTISAPVGALDDNALQRKVKDLRKARNERMLQAINATVLADGEGFDGSGMFDPDKPLGNLQKILLKGYCSKKKDFFKPKFQKPVIPKSGHEGGYGEYDDGHGRELYGGYDGSSSHAKCPAINEECGCTYDLSLVVTIVEDDCAIESDDVFNCAPMIFDPCFLLHVDPMDEITEADLVDLKDVGFVSINSIQTYPPIGRRRLEEESRGFFVANSATGLKKDGCYDIYSQQTRNFLPFTPGTWTDVVEATKEGQRSVITGGNAYAPDGSEIYIDGGYEVSLPYVGAYDGTDIYSINLLYTYYCVDGSSVDTSCDLLKNTLYPPKAISSDGKKGDSDGKKGEAGGKKGDSDGKKGEAGGKKGDSDGKKGGKKGGSADASSYSGGDDDDDYSYRN
jgi:hypothetical protein